MRGFSAESIFDSAEKPLILGLETPPIPLKF